MEKAMQSARRQDVRSRSSASRRNAAHSRSSVSRPRLEPDRLSLYPPEEVAEGCYTFETLREKYVLSDGERTMDIYRMQGLAH